MSLPRISYIPEAQQRMHLTRAQRRYVDEKNLKFYTNVALLVAVCAAVLIAILHRGTVSVSIIAYGAALGMGGVLGFLFGVPSPGGGKGGDNVDNATVTTGAGSVVNLGHGAANPPPAPENPAPNEPPPAAAINLVNDPPAAPSQPAAATPSGPHLPAQNASNLEQVADWVTKLLLGGGLTQMSKIPPKVWQWSHVVAVGIMGKEAINAAPEVMVAQQAFAAGLLVYGFILGFFAGFLITKMQLGKAISS